MYIGPFYFDTKEIFLILLTILLGIAMCFGFEPAWFNTRDVFTLAILILFTKGLLPAIHNEAFFFVALASVVLTLFFPIFQVVLFYLICFVLFRLLRVI